MPQLQIDGVTIAEVDQAIANELLDMAKVGVGRLRGPSVFHGRVHADLAKPKALSVPVVVTVEFPVTRRSTSSLLH
jgi:hypothetical protein